MSLMEMKQWAWRYVNRNFLNKMQIVKRNEKDGTDYQKIVEQLQML